MTTIGLLDVTVPVGGEDFVATFLLETVVPGRDATGTGEMVFVVVAMIDAVGLKNC